MNRWMTILLTTLVLGIGCAVTPAFAAITHDYDFGTLAPGGLVSYQGNLSYHGDLDYYRFVIPSDVDNADGSYLNIQIQPVWGSWVNSQIGLYDAAGQKVAEDNDDGWWNYSLLTFGDADPFGDTSDTDPG
ncbi:MAG: hypothetical protein JW888_17865, partial [Pirellulales bacterium]|nr:hypothetical protein [Pirellulales bacterium]